jgi:hypothetical protein
MAVEQEELELTLRAAIWIAKIRDASPSAHAYKLRCAKVLSELIEEVIKEEVHNATSKPLNDSTRLSWESVGQCLELSKSAAFTRYGNKQK